MSSVDKLVYEYTAVIDRVSTDEDGTSVCTNDSI